MALSTGKRIDLAQQTAFRLQAQVERLLAEIREIVKDLEIPVDIPHESL